MNQASIDEREDTLSGQTDVRKRPRSSTGNGTSGSKPVKQQRTGSLRSTSTRSKYFAQDESNGKKVEAESEDEALGLESSPEGEESDFEGSASKASTPAPSEEDEEDDFSDEKPVKKRKSLSKKSPITASKAAKGQELWREGVKAGLGPGKQVVIKKPKARAAGSTPYSDSTIHPNTLLFLKDLRANNDREWLKSEYRISSMVACTFTCFVVWACKQASGCMQ